MNEDRPIALDTYERIAMQFARDSGELLFNGYYERPAMLNLLPPVDGQSVLDAGCGSGFYVQQLIDRNAQVIGIDASPNMIEEALKAVGSKAELRVHDLSKPLTFVADESISLVISPLVLDHLKDWDPVFGEFFRVLKPGGFVLYSVLHPLSGLDKGSYFDIEYVESELKHFGGKLPWYKRPLGEVLRPPVEAGFVIDRVIEPRPIEEGRLKNPKLFERLCSHPAFLCVRVRK